MTRLRIAYVQSFCDKKTGAVFRYFRRAGYRRVRLPGLPGSTEFMAAYQAALGSMPEPIGVAKRSKAGSVSAAIVSYYGSQSFRNLTGGTPAMRRAILERFRDQHGDKPIALMPKKFIVAVLDQMEPFAARNWLKAIRALMHYCVEHELIRENPTQGIKLPTIKSHGHHTWTEDEIAAFERPIIRSAARHGLPSRSCFTRRNGAATLSAWVASTFATVCFACASRRPAQRWPFPSASSYRLRSTPCRAII